jgi:hypothetical protein
MTERKSWIPKTVTFRADSHEETELLKQLEMRMQIDAWSFTKLSLEAYKEYMMHHPLPNPQSQIDRMLEVGIPHKPTSQCCVPNCKGKARFLLRLKDFEGKQEQFQVCFQHQNWRHARFRFLISCKEIS